MSAYVGKLFTSLSSAFTDLNTATLSGAIDILVIEDDHGRRHSTPFHVRFGKLQLLKARGLPVQIELNGNKTNLRMFLGAAGEAYFYNPKGSGHEHIELDVDTPQLLSLDNRLEKHSKHNLDVPTRAATAFLSDREPISLPANEVNRSSDQSPPTSTDYGISATPISEPLPSGPHFESYSDSGVELIRTERDGSVQAAEAPISSPMYPLQNLSSSLSSSPTQFQLQSSLQQKNALVRSNPSSLQDLTKAGIDRSPSLRTKTRSSKSPEVSIPSTRRDLALYDVSSLQSTLPQPGPAAGCEAEPFNLETHEPASKFLLACSTSGNRETTSSVTIDNLSACNRAENPSKDSTRFQRESNEPARDKPGMGNCVAGSPEKNSKGDASAIASVEQDLLAISFAEIRLPEEVIDEFEEEHVKIDLQRTLLTIDSPKLKPLNSRFRDSSVLGTKASVPEKKAAECGLPHDNQCIKPKVIPTSGEDLAEDAELQLQSSKGKNGRSDVSRIVTASRSISSDLEVFAPERENVIEEPNVSGYGEQEKSTCKAQNHVEIISKSLPGSLTQREADCSRNETHHEIRSGTEPSKSPSFPPALVQNAFINSEHSENESIDALIPMSLCGNLIDKHVNKEESLEIFEKHRIPFVDFMKNPEILYDPLLLLRIDNRLVEFKVAAPFVFAALSFNKRMNLDDLSRLLSEDVKKVENKTPKPPPPTPSRRFRWFSWSSTNVEGKTTADANGDQPNMATSRIEEVKVSLTEEFTVQDAEAMSAWEAGEQICSDKALASTTQQLEEAVSTLKEDQIVEKHNMESLNEEIFIDYSDRDTKTTPNVNMYDMVPFSDIDPDALSLRPTAEQLMELDLQPGPNSIRFIVESGSVELNCRVFLWSCHSKVVISDVDGTITRSDVLGHLLPAVGRDWSQVGVAGLYSHIEKNGYKLLYLTARPIGQASQTRTFIRSVIQGGAKLPNGPVFMSPNRLVESFAREVIRRRPHEFKIAALREIRSLFSPNYNPFHAGFGNRETDVISYRAVGLIPQRIFVVNSSGELAVMKARYESTASYSTLQDLVEKVFPDISGRTSLDMIRAITDTATFNDWNWWKGPLPDIDFSELLDKEE